MLCLACGARSVHADAVDERIDRATADFYAGKYRQAFALALPLAERGNPAALNLLGMMYEQGKGVPADPARAVGYYRQAAEQGDVYAEYNLGVSYETGFGVVMNYHEAVKWYRRAAEKGVDFAQYNLATMYEDGNGVARDAAKAAFWYLKAAEQGNKQAQNNLAWLYSRGQGVGRNLLVAYAWFDAAAAQGLEAAAEQRDLIAAQLTTTELETARELAARFRRQHIPSAGSAPAP